MSEKSLAELVQEATTKAAIAAVTKQLQDSFQNGLTLGQLLKLVQDYPELVNPVAHLPMKEYLRLGVTVRGEAAENDSAELRQKRTYTRRQATPVTPATPTEPAKF